MRKKLTSDLEDEARPEYDLKPLLKNGERGKYVEEYRRGNNVVLLDSDVYQAFPTPEAVNEALRLVMKLAVLPVQAPTGVREE